MNEQAINAVISDYAIENANLKVAVATLQYEIEEMRSDLKEERKGEK